MSPTLPDPRNADIQIHVGGQLLPRSEAKVSVFDSSVQGGDAVWEGLRVYDGGIFRLEAHLDRMMRSAHAMRFAHVPTKDEVRAAIVETLKANGMRDGAHIRLTLTRGEKVTSGMSTKWNQSGSCLIVLAEWKAPVYDQSGIRLVSSAIRRNPPEAVDSKIHHNNLINNILAKIEAEIAGVDDALMLDRHGFVSETNATNVFVVRDGKLLTPFADSCLPGITRRVVLEIAADNDIPHAEKNLSISEIWSADEMLTTGTMGELAPVLEVDGRTIGGSQAGPLTQRLQELYRAKTASEREALPI